MPSSFKTTNLGLNSWIESDKPTRGDFVGDNVIIDNILGAHVKDNSLHLNEEQIAQIEEPYFFDILQGSNEASRSIKLSYTPRFVIYFAVNKPWIEHTTNGEVVNGGISIYTYGSSGGIAIGEEKLIISHGEIDGVNYNLNNMEYQYLLIAFR